jgi:hypothetical protein
MKAQSRSLNGCTVIMMPAIQTTMANFIAPMTMKIMRHQQEAKVIPPKQNHYGKAKNKAKASVKQAKPCGYSRRIWVVIEYSCP